MNKKNSLKVFLVIFISLIPSLLQAQNSTAYYDAITAFYNKDYTKAVIRFDDFFKEYKFQDDLYSSAKYYRSDAYLNLDELDAAEKGFLSLINGNWTSYREESANKLASIYFVKENYPEARKYFNIILKDYPSSSHYASALFWVGESYMKEDNVEEAINFLETSIAKKNKFIDRSIFSLALAYEKTGEYEKAVENYDKLLSFYSSSPLAIQAQVRIGICYFKLKDYQSSILELNNPVLENLPQEKYAEGLYLLANSYYRAEEYSEADKTYNELIKNFSDSELYEESLYGLAWTYFQQNKFNEAYKIFNGLSKNNDTIGINSFFYKGEAKRYQGKDNDAYTIYSEFIENYPEHILADNSNYQLAILEYNNKKFDEAEYYLQNSINSSDNEVRTKALILTGEIKLQQNKITEAQKMFRDASRIRGIDNALNLRARMGEGITRYYLKQYDEAINLLKDVVAKGITDDKDKVNYYIAESYFKQDKYKEAIEYYNKIESSNKDLYDDAIYGKGYAYFNQKDFTNAAEQFEMFVKNNPRDIKYEDAYLRLADSYYAGKRYSAAISIYQRFFNTETQVNDPFTNFQYAQALYKSGKNGEAISELYSLQTKYPQSEYAAKAQFFIGWINFQQNNYEQALNTFRDALVKYPNNAITPQVYYTMGDTYFNLGRFDSAITYYRMVITYYPNSPSANDALNSLQQSYTSMGRTDLAINTIDDYVTRNNAKNADELMFKKGEIYFNSDEYQQAKESFQKFVVQYPSSRLVPDAYFWLGKISEQLNQNEEAVTNYLFVVDRYTQSEVFKAAATELAELYVQQKQYSNAVYTYDKILTKNLSSEEKAEILFLKATALAEEGSLDLAGDIFFSVLQEHTETIYAERAKFELGMISMAKSDYGTAEPYFKNLAETRDDELGATAQFYLGLIYLEQELYEDALTQLVRVNTNFSEFDEWVTRSYLKMGDCYLGLNEKEKARDMFKQVLEKHPKDVYGKEAQNKLRSIK